MSGQESILLSRQMSTIQEDYDELHVFPPPQPQPRTGPLPHMVQSLEPLDPDTLDVSSEEFLHYSVTLYQAALKGDRETIKRICLERPSWIRTRITKGGETVLHIASASKHLNVVEELVNHMSVKSLALVNRVGNTALCFAAVSGDVEIAKTMVKKHKGLPNIRGSHGMTPLHMAVLLGHGQMVTYLLNETDIDQQLSDQDRIGLLTSCIDTDLFDIALYILHRYPYLALLRDAKNETALHALARKPLKREEHQRSKWQRFKRQLINTTPHRSTEPKAALDLVQCLWREVTKQKPEDISKLIASPKRLLFVAARLGKVEFLTVLISSYPDLIWKVDENRYSIFHIAVIHRHEEIFKLFYEIGAIKDLIATYKDDKGNNMLHLVSKLAPPNRLNCVSGAALQMQRELLWFEAVEKIVRPEYAEAENEDHKTPQALFSEEHEVLRSKGEEWMKKTAESCALVATLIATVAFSAAFQLPGGVDKGKPVLVKNTCFVVFAISNAVSLFTSTASILMFLSILTSRYAERDFLTSLPRKLMLGLILLLFSISTMVAAFTSTFFMIFQEGWRRTRFSIALIACIPVILFTFQQFPLLFDIYNSVSGSQSLFKTSKSKLFQLSPSERNFSLYWREEANEKTYRKTGQLPTYQNPNNRLHVSFQPEASPPVTSRSSSTFQHLTASQILNPMASGSPQQGSVYSYNCPAL